MQPIFIISDGSGLTAETIAHTLLSQFPKVEFERFTLPFVDSTAKVQQAIVQIEQAGEACGKRPLVFTTFVEEAFSRQLRAAKAEIFDLFEPFIGRIETALQQTSSHASGQAHGIADAAQYNQRISAVGYALHCDDGLHLNDYTRASVILLGVSRSGKTPTSLYLALHFGFYAANYPLTEDDFQRAELPPDLLSNKARVFGLTIDPLRLHQIRTERRPGSRYASLHQCQQEVQQAQAIFNRYAIPFCDSTKYSVEELGSTIKHQMRLQSALG